MGIVLWVSKCYFTYIFGCFSFLVIPCKVAILFATSNACFDAIWQQCAKPVSGNGPMVMFYRGCYNSAAPNSSKFFLSSQNLKFNFVIKNNYIVF